MTYTKKNAKKTITVTCMISYQHNTHIKSWCGRSVVIFCFTLPCRSTCVSVMRKKDYYCDMYDFISAQYQQTKCFPAFENIFAAFNMTPFETVKCVILGQDPYHGENQAMGLHFEKCPHPKNPLPAEYGDGCAASNIR